MNNSLSNLAPVAYRVMIRGDRVILSSSETKVKEGFEKTNFVWNDKMRNMLGKKFKVLKVLDNDIIALPSPDGSQNGKYYFPKSVLQLTGKPMSCEVLVKGLYIPILAVAII